MVKEVNVKGIGVLEFPDDMADNDIEKVIKTHPDYARAEAENRPQWRKNLHNIGSQFLQGTVGLGNYAPEGLAGLQALFHGPFGTGTSGDNLSQRYKQNLENINRESDEFRQQHPYASTGLRLGGAAASIYPAARTASTLLEGSGMPANIAGQAAVGAVGNTADKAIRNYKYGIPQDFSDLSGEFLIGAGSGSVGAMLPPILGGNNPYRLSHIFPKYKASTLPSLSDFPAPIPRSTGASPTEHPLASSLGAAAGYYFGGPEGLLAGLFGAPVLRHLMGNAPEHITNALRSPHTGDILRSMTTGGGIRAPDIYDETQNGP